MKKITRTHFLHCDCTSCKLPIRLIVPGKPAYQMDDGTLNCEACAASKGPLPAD